MTVRQAVDALGVREKRPRPPSSKSDDEGFAFKSMSGPIRRETTSRVPPPRQYIDVRGLDQASTV